MNKLTRSSPALSGNEKDDSSLDDYKDTFLDIEDERNLISGKDLVVALNASTPCLTGSRPSSSVGTGCEWEEPWMSNMANSDSCLVSSSSYSNASPLTGTSSQGISPLDVENKVFSFETESKDPDMSLCSINEALQTEKAFMEYVMSFPVTEQTVVQRSENKRSPSDSSPKVGLDHLDNLCKLMEQLSDLKEANFKLKRRVQYLEDLRTLHEIHREMFSASTLCNSGASEDEVQRDRRSRPKASPNRGRSEERRKSPPFFEDDDVPSEYMLGLYRSKTTTEVDTRLDQKRENNHRSRNSDLAGKEKVRERSKSVGHPGHLNKTKKRSSRWSKVKEVLGIEKQESTADDRNHSEHSTNVSCEKVNDNQIMRTEMDQCCCTEAEIKDRERTKNHKELSQRPRSTVLSSGSFSKTQSFQMDSKNEEKADTMDNQNSTQKSFARMEKYEQGSKKFAKTPWGRMKTMINIRRDCRTQKSESSSSSSRGASEKVANESIETVTNGQQSHRRNVRPSRKPSFTLHDVPKKHTHDMKNAHNEPTPDQKEAGTQLVRQKRCSAELNRKIESPEHELQRTRSTKSTHRPDEELPAKDTEDKEKTAFANSESKTEGSISYNEISNRTTTFDSINESEKATIYEEKGDAGALLSISPKKKNSTTVQDAMKEQSQSDDTPSQQEPDNEIQGSKEGLAIPPCASATVTELLKELQQNLSDDFNRKLEEWQRFRGNEGIKPQNTEVERKDSFGRFRKSSKPEKKPSTNEKSAKHNMSVQKKDLNWLEKELQKVEREILRLSKEKQKFEKRAFRLQKLKDAMTDSHKKNEVLVRTPAGEFRFEGISNAFTKKLYEWETKQGVGPELSTIALLDESLKPPNELPLPGESLSVTDIDKRSIATSSDLSEKFCYQKSRASSEPDLSTLSSAQKDSTSTMQTVRSKSGDTLLATSTESIICSSNKIDDSDKVIDIQEVQLKSGDLSQNHDDNYYSLLEENMFLLDQLKGKEDICSKLQNELDRLDERAEKANVNHQEEMEKYRQKLWEIHMSRPRDLQGSLQLISELKTRIEELQKCSDKLKSDREKLELSFRYHTEQQRHLADDLIHRMVELQEVGLPAIFNRTGCRRKWRKSLKCDAGSVARIHELSTKLLQQARDMEEALAEKSRQVCHLRWELLHRDMSAVLLQAALHRVTSQGPQASILPAWDMKRIKFKELKAWSIDTTTRRQSEDTTAEDWLQDRLKQLSLAPYNKWTSVEFNPNDLMSTVHELKKETIRMSCCRTNEISEANVQKTATSFSAESEMADSDRNYDTGSAFNSRSSSLSSGPCGGLRGSHSDTRLYERSRSLSISARRNSSSSMSCVSGFDASESSSLHDSDRIHFLGNRGGSSHRNRRRSGNRWPSRDNTSSSCSSRSSGLEDDVNCSHWNRNDERADDGLPYDTLGRQLQLKYGVFKETDEENMDTGSKDWGSQCLITPKPMHVGLHTDGNPDKTESSYSFLKALMSHSPYATQINESSSEHETLFKAAESPNSTRLRETGHSNISELSYHNPESQSIKTGPIIDTVLYGKDKVDSYDALSHNSSAYTSAESLDNFKYVTEREQQLFTDIRNLAESCDIRNLAESCEMNSEIRNDTSNELSKSELLNEEQAKSFQIQELGDMSKSPDITQFKYKGTKGFGRSNRMNFGNNIHSNTNPALSGVEVASDRSPDARFVDPATENCPSVSTLDQLQG